MAQYIMHKNEPVLKIEDNYSVKILQYNFLPYALRYPDVNYDDIMHGWTETRSMNIGRTNAKKILSALGISQRNPYMIAKSFHFASLTDCYWVKEEQEAVSWEDVSLFKGEFHKGLTNTALFGADIVPVRQGKITTPEVSTVGQAAKAWIRRQGDIWLYKVGRKELAAGQILDLLGIDHVSYEKATEEELREYTDERHLARIKEQGECVVKCKCITSEDISLITWEDYQIFCDRNDLDPYEIIEKENKKAFADMQVADYILNNSDRHEGNWGFFVNNDTGEIIKLHPLFDHDHAFEEGNLRSQTHPLNVSLLEAAETAESDANIETLINEESSLRYLTEKEKEDVIERAISLERLKEAVCENQKASEDNEEEAGERD